MAVLSERQTETYLFADQIPEAALERDAVRAQAWQTVYERESQLASGMAAEVPLAVDALSTADIVLEMGARHGIDSHAYNEKLAGLELDCLRLVAEWYRKKRPEYFPASRHFFDAETGDFYSHGLSIRQMTENALRPIDDDPEEVERRVNERVENETPHIVRKIGGFALGSLGIRTISECTDKAIADYRADMQAGRPHNGYNGYVPEIEKVMIRDIRFDETTGDRLEEQVGLPGIFINHDIIQRALRERGIEAGHLNKTELHGSQLLVADDLIDFVKLLDDVAGREWCTNIFMGEQVAPEYRKDYGSIREESRKRQEGLKDLASTVAVFALDLASCGVDRRKAPALIEEFVKKQLLNLAKHDRQLAVQIFDEQTADGLGKVMRLEAAGQLDRAFREMRRVESEAPGGGYCGAGSCGLEGIDLSSKEGRQLAKQLGIGSGDTVVKDKERACRCGKKSIVYAYNKSKVTKLCQSCGAFESKVSKVA